MPTSIVRSVHSAFQHSDGSGASRQLFERQLLKPWLGLVRAAFGKSVPTLTKPLTPSGPSNRPTLTKPITPSGPSNRPTPKEPLTQNPSSEKVGRITLKELREDQKSLSVPPGNLTHSTDNPWFSGLHRAFTWSRRLFEFSATNIPSIPTPITSSQTLSRGASLATPTTSSTSSPRLSTSATSLGECHLGGEC